MLDGGTVLLKLDTDTSQFIRKVKTAADQGKQQLSELNKVQSTRLSLLNQASSVNAKNLRLSKDLSASERKALATSQRDLELAKLKVKTAQEQVKIEKSLNGLSGKGAQKTRAELEKTLKLVNKLNRQNIDLNFDKTIRGINETKRGLTGIQNLLGKGLAVAAGVGVAGALAAFGGLVVGGRKAIQGAIAAEQFETQLTTLTGSESTAQQVNREVTNFAATTPFQLPEVQEASRLLLAMGIEAEELSEHLKVVGDTSAALNIPYGELADIYGKINVQGRIYKEDLNQLQSRGIPIVSELAKQFGVTEEEILKMASAGELMAEDLQAGMAAMTNEDGIFANMMENLSKTTGGQLSNLVDRVNQAFVEIGKLIQPIFNSLLASTLEIIDSIDIDFSPIIALAERLGDSFSGTSNVVKVIADVINGGINGAIKIATGLANDLLNYFEKNPGLLREAQEYLRMISSVLNVVLPVVGKILNFVKDLLGWLLKIGAWIATQLMRGLNQVLRTTGQILRAIWDWSEPVRDGLIKGLEKALDFLKLIGETVLNIGKGLVEAGKAAASLVGSVGKAVFGTNRVNSGGHTARARGSVGRGGIGMDVYTPYFIDNSPPGSYDYTLADGATGNQFVPAPSPVTGTIDHIGDDPYGYGLFVDIRDAATGLIHRFAHLEEFLVGVGDQIQAGQAFGIQGSSGNSSGPHLHHEIWDPSGHRITDRNFTQPIVEEYINNIRSGVFDAASREFNSNDPARIAYDFFRNQGASEYAAAMLTGNIQQESNFDPSAVGDGGLAHGIFQWHPDRRNDAFPYDDFQGQLQYAWDELAGSSGSAVRGIDFHSAMASSDPNTVQSAIEAAIRWGHTGSRWEYGENYFNQFRGTSSTSGPGFGGSSNSDYQQRIEEERRREEQLASLQLQEQRALRDLEIERTRAQEDLALETRRIHNLNDEAIQEEIESEKERLDIYRQYSDEIETNNRAIEDFLNEIKNVSQEEAQIYQQGIDRLEEHNDFLRESRELELANADALAKYNAELERTNQLNELRGNARDNLQDLLGRGVEARATVIEDTQGQYAANDYRRQEGVRQIRDDQQAALFNITTDRDLGLISQEEFDRAKEAIDSIAQADLSNLIGQTQTLGDVMGGAVTGAFENFFSSLVSGTTTFNEAISSLFSNLASQLAQLAVNAIFQQLFGAIGGVTGGGLFGGLFGGGSGSSLMGMFGAYNGYVPNSSPLSAIEQELRNMPSGSNLVIANSSEAILTPQMQSNLALGLSGGSSSSGGAAINSTVAVTVNNQGAANSVANTDATNLSKRIESVVKQVLYQEKRPGGILAT